MKHLLFTGISALFLLIIGFAASAATSRAAEAHIPLQSHDFTDVPVTNKEFMEPFIDAFYHQGVTAGCNQSPLQYCPENNVTRGEMAVFLGRALGYLAAEADVINAEAYFKQVTPGGSYHGVVGRSIDGHGAIGLSTNGYGVYGNSQTNWGVYGSSTNSYGVGAISTNNYGLSASSTTNTALLASSSTDALGDSVYDVQLGGNFGEILGSLVDIVSLSSVTIELDNDDTQTAASFAILNSAESILFSMAETGAATLNGTLTVTNLNVTGTKAAIVDTVHYGTRTMYAVESAENWFEDFGSAQLVNGVAVIQIDAMFAETVNLSEEYHVFLTPIDGTAVLNVANMTATTFEVHSANRHANIRFSYRLVAKRLGYEDVRMEEVGND